MKKEPNLIIEMVHYNESKITSSITLGTPGKSGEVKVYVDPSNPQEAKDRIDTMLELRKYMQGRLQNDNSNSSI